MTAFRAARTGRAMTVEFKSASGVTLEDDLIKALDELLKPTDAGAAVTRPKRRALFWWTRFCRACRRKGRLGSMASIPFADGRLSMICASPVPTFSSSIGSHFATPCKSSNATSVHPIIG